MDSSLELGETRKELLAQIAYDAKSWDRVDSEDSRKNTLDRKTTPTTEDPLLASTVLTTGENGFDIKMS